MTSTLHSRKWRTVFEKVNISTKMSEWKDFLNMLPRFGDLQSFSQLFSFTHDHHRYTISIKGFSWCFGTRLYEVEGNIVRTTGPKDDLIFGDYVRISGYSPIKKQAKSVKKDTTS